MTNVPKPTEAELEVLQVLWKDEPSSVRFVNDTLNKKRKVGYTTTLKIMQIMFEKGLLHRESQGRGHVYTAAYREQETQRVLLDRFLDSAFGGSAMKLVMQALGNRKTSRDELKQIKDYLETMEEEKR